MRSSVAQQGIAGSGPASLTASMSRRGPSATPRPASRESWTRPRRTSPRHAAAVPKERPRHAAPRCRLRGGGSRGSIRARRGVGATAGADRSGPPDGDGPAARERSARHRAGRRGAAGEKFVAALEASIGCRARRGGSGAAPTSQPAVAASGRRARTRLAEAERILGVGGGRGSRQIRSRRWRTPSGRASRGRGLLARLGRLRAGGTVPAAGPPRAATTSRARSWAASSAGSSAAAGAARAGAAHPGAIPVRPAGGGWRVRWRRWRLGRRSQLRRSFGGFVEAAAAAEEAVVVATRREGAGRSRKGHNDGIVARR